MMRWFAWQRAAGDGFVPVAFDERPTKTLMGIHFQRLAEGTLTEIPEGLRDRPLAELAEWALLAVPLPQALAD